MKTLWIGLAALAALALAGCTTPGPKERMQARLALYEEVAGEPVDSFWYPRIDRWEPLAEDRLAVWINLRQGFLMKVEKPCSDLEWSHAIQVTSSVGRVHSRFDRVIAGQNRCRIIEIRPVERDAFREAERRAAGATGPVI